MAGHPTELLFLSKADIDSIITYEDVVRAVEAAFLTDGRGEMYVPPKEIMEPVPGSPNALFAMPGMLKDIGIAGVKWVGFYPESPEGLPTLWGILLILSHISNGQPYAILDATTITAMRTSGGHAVAAARQLARPDSRRLGVLGCGAQGESGIISFDRHFDLEEITVYNTSRERFEALKSRIGDSLNARLTRSESPQTLCEGADIILAATTSEEPLIRAEWVPEGCFVAAMYAFNDVDPRLHETADKWVIGHAGSDREEILDNPAFAGRLVKDRVYGTLGEILAGEKPGRESSRERIVFTHMGMGTLDIAVGNLLVEKAQALGLGQTLRLT